MCLLCFKAKISLLSSVLAASQKFWHIFVQSIRSIFWVHLYLIHELFMRVLSFLNVCGFLIIFDN